MSSIGTGSNYPYPHELSSLPHNRSRRTQQSRITTNIVGGTQNGKNDSEDELVKEPSDSITSTRWTQAEEQQMGITVSTTVQMQFKNEDHEVKN
jgi:hypothetical protein